jgi:voltage-gated potassium channel Kch
MAVYFIGVLFYFASGLTLKLIGGTEEDSFHIYVDDDLKNEFVLATLIYFSMTTLAKIGYGDFFPLSDAEKLYTLGILLFSLVFFSFLLDRFIDILQNSPSAESTTQTVDIVSERIALFTWLTQLTRYRDYKDLPASFRK